MPDLEHARLILRLARDDLVALEVMEASSRISPSIFGFHAQLMDTQHPHHFKIFLWEARPGSETFHDRYILTDQCGISVPAGLDCRADSAPNSTTWSLLDEEDRVRRLQDFDPATSSFRLLGEKEVL